MSPLFTVSGYICLAIDYSIDGQFHYTGYSKDGHMCDDGNEPVNCESHPPLVPANHASLVIPNNPSPKGSRRFLFAFSHVV
jgi:hypothetical protein